MSNLIPDDASSESIVAFGRLSNLSDGVFAIALTLLVLDIRVPDNVLAGDLPASLLALAPKLLVYLISFIVIGGAWGSHQRMISQIRRGDGLLVWLNLLSLLFVTLLPASAALLGRFPETFAAILCFALDVILIQLSARWLWQHASISKLINPALDQRVVVSISRRLMLSAGAFTLSLPLTLLSPILVYVVWIGLFAVIFTTDWLTWQQASKTMQASIPLNDALQAETGLTHTIGSLSIQAGAAEDQLLEGTFGGGVDLNSTQTGNILKAQLNAIARRGLIRLRYPWSWDASMALDWKLALNPEISLKLNLDMRVNQVNLDLRDLHLSDLSLKSNTSYINLWLPTHAGQTTMQLQGSTATFVIHVPPDVAVHVLSTNSISGLEVDTSRFALIQNGREYRSPDYDSAANKVDIQLNVTLGSTQIV